MLGYTYTHLHTEAQELQNCRTTRKYRITEPQEYRSTKEKIDATPNTMERQNGALRGERAGATEEQKPKKTQKTGGMG